MKTIYLPLSAVRVELYFDMSKSTSHSIADNPIESFFETMANNLNSDIEYYSEALFEEESTLLSLLRQDKFKTFLIVAIQVPGDFDKNGNTVPPITAENIISIAPVPSDFYIGIRGLSYNNFIQAWNTYFQRYFDAAQGNKLQRMPSNIKTACRKQVPQFSPGFTKKCTRDQQARLKLFAGQLFKIGRGQEDINTIEQAIENVFNAKNDSKSVAIEMLRYRGEEIVPGFTALKIISNLIISVAVAVSLAAVTFCIGGVIGFFCGAWTGPGALFTAIAGATSTVAVGITLAAGVAGLIGGGMSMHALFKPSKLQQTFDAIVDDVEKNKFTSPSITPT